MMVVDVFFAMRAARARRSSLQHVEFLCAPRKSDRYIHFFISLIESISVLVSPRTASSHRTTWTFLHAANFDLRCRWFDDV